MRYEDASGSFQASGPNANDDSDTLSAGSRQAATGNLITGEGTQYGAAGADSAAGGHITSIAGKGGEDSSFAGGKLGVTGEHGNLSVDAEGNYNYIANKGAPENVRDRFIYTLADNQGNSDTAALVIELGKTPVVIKADAQQVVPGPDGVVTLPPGVELSDVMVVGRNLVINMPDGTQLIIVDGAIFVPQLVLDGVQVPATNVAALLIGQEPQPAAGELPPSSGGNFALPPPPLDPGVPLGDLIPPTVRDYIPPEPQEVFDTVDDEPELIIIPDGQPGAVNAVDSVDESGLPERDGEPEGTLEPQTIETTTGVISISGDDGIDSVTINGVEIDSIGDTVETVRGILTITSIDLDSGEIGYRYTATDNTTDGVDDFDDFTVVVTDDDGDTAIGTLHIDILDDEPIARDDTDSVTIDNPTAVGNVMTAVGTTNSPAGVDTVGADDAALTAVQGVGPADTSFDINGNLFVNGQFGTLTIDAEGNYTYVRDEGTLAGGNDVFTYTLTDGDGDTITATLTITVPPIPNENDIPEIFRVDDSLVDEDGLEDANVDGVPLRPGEEDSTEATTDTGQILVDFKGDVPANLLGAIAFINPSSLNGQLTTPGGDPITFTVNGSGQLVGSDGTNDVLIIEFTAAAPQGSGQVLYTYTVELLGPVEHPVEGVEDTIELQGITVQVTDSNGDTDFATFDTAIVDDLPIAVEPPGNPQDPEGPPLPIISGAVDEDDLGTGNNDVAPGDDLPINSSTTFSGAAGSLAALFNAGADQPLTFALNSDTLGLPPLHSGGVEVTYVVDGDTLTASAGSETVFTLTVNPDGSWSFELEGQLDHPDTTTEDNIDIDFSSIISAEDADGDPVTAADGAFVINVDDDSPTAIIPPIDPENPNDPPAPLVSGLVDEDDLDTGNNDNATGDDDPGDADGDADGTTTGGAAGSLDGLFNAGADQPLTYTLGTDTSGLPTLHSGGVEVTYVVDGDTLTASAGLETVFTLTVNPDGSWAFDLEGQLDHPIADTEDNIDIDFSSIISAEDADGDPVTAADGAFVVTVDDDMPVITRNLEVVPFLVTDDTGIPDTAGPVSFAGLFDENFGADGPDADAVSYGLSITGGDGADSGLIDVISGDAILLRVNGDTIEGYLAGSPATVAFIISLDPATGEISLEQDRAITHDDPGDPVESGLSAARMAADAIVLTATITDGDGDSASASANIGLSFNFEDDGPTITRNGQAAPILVTDDTDIPDAAGPVNFAALFDSSFGNDGPKDADDNDVADADALVFSLSIAGGDGTDSGLVDVISGDAILLRVNGDTIEGYLANDTGTVAFTITLDPATGEISLGQDRAITHDNETDPVETGAEAQMMAANLIVLTATITDGDGDTAIATADIGDAFAFEDDGPSITRNEATVPVLVTDDTDTPNALAGPVSFDGLFDSLFGNDGPKDTDDNDVADADAVGYGLSITGGDGADSGLIDVASGDAILLRVNGDTIEGYLENDTGTVAFIITLDPATGEISLKQERAITHDDPNDPVESGASAATMAANLIVLTATVTDGDGDTATATADIGNAFAFEDDGPSASDEPQQDVPEGQTITGAFDFDPGADGATVTHIDDVALVFDIITGWSQWIPVDDGQIRAMADGSYEFQSNVSGSLVTSGTFTVTDGDGDPVNANWAFNITDANSPTGGASNARLDDDGLTSPAGNPASTTGDIDANASPPEAGPIDPSEAVFHGELTLNFGGDGPGTVTFEAMDGLSGTVGTDSVLYTWNAGTSTMTATIATPGSLRLGTTLFDIVVNQATGEYTLTLRDNVLHAAGGDETSAPNVVLTYTVTDSDNSPAGGADGTLTIDFNDDAPTVTVNAEVEPTLEVDESDFLTDAGPTSFAALFDVNFGADGEAATDALSYELTINTGETGLVDTLTGEGVVLVKNGETVEGRTETTLELVFVISVNVDGEVSLDQQRSIVHPDPDDPNESITLADDSLITLGLTATDGDGDSHTVADPINIAQNFVFYDDAPSAFEPEDATLTNAAGNPIFFQLDPAANGGDNNILNNFGADGAGFVRFPSTIDNTDSGLTSGTVKIWYILDPTGQTLLGRTGVDAATAEASGTTIFTIAIDQANSQYSIDMNGTVDAFTTINFSDGTYDFVGGNDAWAGFVPTGQKESGTPLNDDSQDLLLTPIGSGTAVNGNATSAGVTGGIAGQNIGANEGMRLDFIEDLTGIPTAGDYNVVGEQTHDFDAHYFVNGATLQFVQGTSPLTKVSFKAILVEPQVIDDDGDDGTADLVDGTGTLVSVTRIIISYDGENQFVDFDPLDLDHTQTVTVGNAGGLTDRTYIVEFVESGGKWYAEVQGVYDNLVRISTVAEEPYNALELLHLGPPTPNADFAISGFGVAVQSTDPVLFSLPVEIVDGDGDILAATNDINITLNPVASLLAPLAAESTSLETNDSTTKLAWSDPSFLSTTGNQRLSGGQDSTGIMAGIVAAAGMMSTAAAARIDHGNVRDLQAGDHTIGQSGQRAEHLSISGDFDIRSFLALDQEAAVHRPGAAQSASSGYAETTNPDRSIDDSPSEAAAQSNDQPTANYGPVVSSVEAGPVAPTVNMPSAEALQAIASSSPQEGGSVEQVVAAALDHAGTSPIDALLANLSGGHGGLEAIAHLLAPGNEVVSGWGMTQHDSPGAGFDVASKIDVKSFHHDAVQPTANG